MSLADRLLAPASERELSMLFSFHYYGKFDFAEYVGSMAVRPMVMVDSGGFSAHTQGAEISLDAYVGWLRRNADWIDLYANLDEIGDPAGTLRNQLRMERMGMRPMPIVHFGSDPRIIAQYAANGYDYQALGGMVPHLRGVARAARDGKPHELIDWLDRCHDVAGASGVGLHGFGATTWSIVELYPWRSVDSSSWSSGYRYGTASLFDWRLGRWRSFQIRDVAAIMPMAGLIRSYGVDPMFLIHQGEGFRAAMIALSARSWLAAQRWLNKDCNIFLASASTTTEPHGAAEAVSWKRVFLVDGSPEHPMAAAQAVSGAE